MRSADGSFGRPGMVTISPVRATTKPAPAAGHTSLIVMWKPEGRPRIVGSSVSEYCVFAIQTGVCPNPADSARRGRQLLLYGRHRRRPTRAVDELLGLRRRSHHRG